VPDELAKHEDGLRRMLADAHGRRYPGSAGVFYEHAPVGTGIAGGTGGGTVVAGIWLTPGARGQEPPHRCGGRAGWPDAWAL